MLVVTEGVRTEVQYLEGLVQHLRSTGTSVRGVRSKGIGRDPSQVVGAAIEMRDADTDGYSATWVVVDVDNHATLDSALREATKEKINVVVSNPCFEMWLLWHYEECTSYQETKSAIARLTRFGHTDKQMPNSFPYHGWNEAVRRAGDSVACGCRGPNPSTAMPHLVEALRSHV